ncbi:hypothetical protein ACFYST_08125 [Kitasatospora sp. NPDC004614]|uniref:hypothetical protein n=1 Tax=unclassified Kitasatospora TaxID=2633591 RepID=UPI0036C5314E
MAAIPQDLLDRLRAVERQVRELAGRSQIRPALDQIQHGQVIIGEGGTLTVKDADGTAVLHIGDILPAHPDGTKQYGVLMRREDNSLALSLWTDGTVPQGLDIWDSRGNTIFSEDRVAGGLARPYLETPLYPSGDLEKYAWTTESTPDPIISGTHWRQHPNLSVRGYLQADNGTVGRCQVYVSGQPWGDVHEVNSDWTFWVDGSKPVAGTVNQSLDIEIRAWRVSGNGRVRVCADSCTGRQS